MSRKSPHVLLNVSFEKMCIQCCLEDTDFCAGSDIVWKCIPGLCCGYSEWLGRVDINVCVIDFIRWTKTLRTPTLCWATSTCWRKSWTAQWRASGTPCASTLDTTTAGGWRLWLRNVTVVLLEYYDNYKNIQNIYFTLYCLIYTLTQKWLQCNNSRSFSHGLNDNSTIICSCVVSSI